MNVVAGPFEESDLKTLFQFVYLMRNGRLCKVEHPCCSCETSVFSHFEKGLDRIKLKGAHDIPRFHR